MLSNPWHADHAFKGALLAAFLSLALIACTQDRDFEGRVVGVTDGDTVTVLAGREQIRVRIGEIDAPERGQPYANRSQQLLSSLVFGKDVLVRYQDTDQYGRIVGRLYVGDIDVSAALVREGAAWVYADYLRDKRLLALEQDARSNRRGLWGLSEFERIEPWEWHRGVRPSDVAVPAAELPEPFTCGTKRVCREMVSCEEARFHLKQCGLASLDGDDDGIPCEAICQ